MNLQREAAESNNIVIPNQFSNWCGNLHRISGSSSSYKPLFLCRFPESICVLSRNSTSIQEIATEAGALVRNDWKFGKFPFVDLLD